MIQKVVGSAYLNVTLEIFIIYLKFLSKFEIRIQNKTPHTGDTNFLNMC